MNSNKHGNEMQTADNLVFGVSKEQGVSFPVLLLLLLWDAVGGLSFTKSGHGE